MNIQKRRNLRSAILFILPFLILYVIFTIGPMVYGFYISLHKWGLMGKQGFIGFKNYEKFTVDRHFSESLLHTLKYVAIITPCVVILALITAILANRPVRGQKFFRVSFYYLVFIGHSYVLYINYFFRPYTGFMNDFYTQ